MDSEPWFKATLSPISFLFLAIFTMLISRELFFYNLALAALAIYKNVWVDGK